MNSLLKANEIVLKKYAYDDEFFAMYVLAIFGLLKKYPNEEELIEEVFLKTDIYIENNPVNKILENHNISCFDYSSDEEMGDNTIYGISSHNHNIIMSDDGSFSFQEETPFLVCSLKECNPSILLNTFVHEMLHLVKGYKNSFNYQNNGEDFSYSIRCGIAFYDYEYIKSEDTLSSLEYFDTLDEAINVINTTEVMEEIMAIKDIITDNKLLNFFNLLDESIINKDSGYEEAVLIIRPLWSIKFFQNLIDNNIIDGNTFQIVEEFDSLTFPGAFEELAELIDKIDELSCTSTRNKKLVEYKTRVNDIIKSIDYKEKVKHSYKNNNG